MCVVAVAAAAAAVAEVGLRAATAAIVRVEAKKPGKMQTVVPPNAIYSIVQYLRCACV